MKTAALKILLIQFCIFLSFISEAQDEDIQGPSTALVGETTVYTYYPESSTLLGARWTIPTGTFSAKRIIDQPYVINVTWTSPGPFTIIFQASQGVYLTKTVQVSCPTEVYNVLKMACMQVKLSSSQQGITYQLFRNGAYLVGEDRIGNGSPLIWPVIVGNYTVKAVSGSCISLMTGAADFTPQTPTVGGSSLACQGTNNVYQTEIGKSDYAWTVSGGGTITAGGSSTDNTVTVTWNTDGAQSVRVSYKDEWCTSSYPSTLNVSVPVSPSTPTFTTGATSSCVGSSETYTTQSGMTNYVWNVIGGTITSGGTSTSNTVTVLWNAEGSQHVGVRYTQGSCTSPVKTIDIAVGTPPSAITSIDGLKLNFVNEPLRLKVVGSADATDFKWSPASVTFTNISASEPNREVLATSSVAGTETFSVKPVRNGCEGPATTVQVQHLSTALRLDSITMYKADMQSASTNTPARGYIFFKKHSENYNASGGCISGYGPITIRTRLDFGDYYNAGKRPSFTATVTANIRAYYDLPGVASGTEEDLGTVTFSLTERSPEQLFLKTIPANLKRLKFIKVDVTNFVVSDPVMANFIRLKVNYQEEDEVNVQALSVTLLNANTEDNSKWERTFSWTGCPDIPNYEFQLLQLPVDYAPANMDDEWKKALVLYTEGSKTSMTVALAQGSGHYYWRVRPIGNVGGESNNPVTDPTNWSPVWATGNFLYTHPEENKNWIYSRTFTEGNRVSEQVTYANGLQQVTQQQTRIQGQNQIVATQTIQDFTGRNALTSLPIPAKDVNTLGYRGDLLKSSIANYGAADFDSDVTLKNPSTAVDYGDYYSGNDKTINAGVASAEGYPYTRTVFTTDGTGRVKEQAGVGATHSLKGGKTVKIFYQSPSESELLQLFGKEAPSSSSVQKIITYDANGTGSATYKNKDGKVIATAIIATGGGPLDLPTTNTSKTFSEEVTGNMNLDDNTVVTRKPLFFPQPNRVTIDYSINPTTINELCNSTTGTFCKTCDYTVTISLSKQDDPNFVQPTGLPASAIIPGGVCGAGASPSLHVEVDLQGGVGYILEKRIQINNIHNNAAANTKNLYIDEHVNELLALYQARHDAVLSPILAYLQAEDFTGLYSYLNTNTNATFDATTNQYTMSLGAPAGGCPEFIFIPKVDPCPKTIPDAGGACTLDGKTFRQYFETSILEQNPDFKLEQQRDDEASTLTYAFFKNRYTNTNQYFTADQFDAMMTNLLTENAATNMTCQVMWDTWQAEVAGYLSRGSIDLSGEDLTDYSANVVVGENNIFDSFLSSLDNGLKKDMPGNDLCVAPTGGNRYFIKKTELYGKMNNAELGNPSAPDLTHAYRLVYYNEPQGDLYGTVPVNKDMRDMLTTLAGLPVSVSPTPPTVLSPSNFTNLTDCQQYNFYNLSRSGNFSLTEEEVIAKRNAVLGQLRGKCGDQCQSRAESFRAAIIQSIFSQDSLTKIEHYAVTQNNFLYVGADKQYVAARVITVNDGVTVDYTECQLDAMVDALVQNCKTKYCNTALTQGTDGVLGLPEEWDNIKKALTYDFEVKVKPKGEVCDNDWNEVDNSSTPDVNNLVWTRYDDSNTVFSFSHLDRVGNVFSCNKGHIQKISNTGELLWNLELSSSDDAMGIRISDMKIDKSNNFIIAGTLMGIVDFDPLTTQLNIGDNISNLYMFVAKYDQNRNLIWAKSTLMSYPINKDINPYRFVELDIDSEDNIYLSAKRVLGIDLDFSASVVSVANRLFFAKYDKDLNYLWHNSINMESSYGDFNGLEIDGNNFVITTFRSYPSLTLYFSNGTQQVLTSSSISSDDLIIAKFNRDGSLNWLKSPVVDDLYNTVISPNVSIGDNNDIYVLEDFGSLYKFDTNGNLLWVRWFNTVNVNLTTASFDKKTNSIVVLGRFKGQLDLDFSSNQFIISSKYDNPSQEVSEIFIAKYSIDGNFIAGSKVEGTYSTPLYTRRFQSFQNAHVLNGEIFLQVYLSSGHLESSSLEGPGSIIGKFAIESSRCSVSSSLCFRFTPPGEITIPDGVPVYDPQEITCAQASASSIREVIDDQVSQLLIEREQAFRKQYKTCADPSSIHDKLTISYSTDLRQYTLYYYDRAGNLLRTVPPEGVALLDVSTAEAIATARTIFPPHTLVTEYHYNSLGQLVREHSPDANPVATSRPDVTSDTQLNASDYYATFIYNDIGQLRFSRNAKQKAEGKYAYTKYDELGRVIEVGEATGYDETLLQANRNKRDNSFPAAASISQVTHTTYGLPCDPALLPTGYTQESFLRNRVSYAYLDEDGQDATPTDRTYTIYNYDTHGNVKWLVQNIPGLPAVAIHYDYDLISGKVLQVRYNPGKADQFFHKYSYDANNRLTSVQTSQNGYLWERDATYEYYLHGPLKRSQIGEDLVQGLDYTYTIHGWLKGINHPLLDITSDPVDPRLPKDGYNGAGTVADPTSKAARDAFGMALSYYSGDYKRPGSYLDITTTNNGIVSPATSPKDRNLYNGNIASWTSNMRYVGALDYAQLTGQRYAYDELNRITSSTMVAGGSEIADFKSTYTYDRNGNITTHTNTGKSSAFDNLIYNYYPNTNKLSYVTDANTNGALYDKDVDTQAAGNYQYDAIGNLISDTQQQIKTITWTPYGKVKQVLKNNGAHTDFGYDASGNRVLKKRVNTAGLTENTYYVRDASGNTMAVYNQQLAANATTGDIALEEVPLYGSDRLGSFTKAIGINLPVGQEPLQAGETRIPSTITKTAYENTSYLVDKSTTLTLAANFSYTSTATTSFSVRVAGNGAAVVNNDLYTRELGNRKYELKDHLGNVRTTVTDIKLSTWNATKGVFETFLPEVTGTYNYYPFGMDQPNRTWSIAGKYRYGFNGQEKDGNGEFGEDYYAFKYRMYNPSIGRFLTPDPLEAKYPHNSPYAFAENKLGLGREYEGLELVYFDPGLAAAYHYTYGRGDGDIGIGDFVGGFGMAFLETFTPFGTFKRTAKAAGNYASNEIHHASTQGEQYQDAVVNNTSTGKVSANYEFNKFKAKIELVEVEMEWVALCVGASMGALEGTVLNITPKQIPFMLDPKRAPFKPVNQWTSSVDEEAFNHAISRHGKEFGLRWGKRETWQSLVDKFNSGALEIRNNGEYIGVKKVEFGSRGSGKSSEMVDAHVYEYNKGGESWYYHETLDGRFISAGKNTRN